MKKLKGQISFAEYLVAVVIFISFVGYFSFQLLNFFPAYLTQIRSERVRSEAYQLSEILVNDPGYPIDWYSNPNSIQRIGLSDETQNVTNVISTAKLNQFIALCKGNGYVNVKKLLGAQSDFSALIILFNATSGSASALLTCQPTSVLLRDINTTIRRFADINSSFYSEIILQVV